ncbi:hypothetical protein [Vibrio vulnificus]|uniref:hypothetical protein n=1 Tax=Vibrio vulnificus TaxID=672 RepID=UPI0032420D6A
MKKLESIASMFSASKTDSVQKLIILLLALYIAKDFYIEAFVEPELRQIEIHQKIEELQRNEAMKTQLSTCSIGLDYALNGDMKTASLIKNSTVNNENDLYQLIMDIEPDRG